VDRLRRVRAKTRLSPSAHLVPVQQGEPVLLAALLKTFTFPATFHLYGSPRLNAPKSTHTPPCFWPLRLAARIEAVEIKDELVFVYWDGGRGEKPLHRSQYSPTFSHRCPVRELCRPRCRYRPTRARSQVEHRGRGSCRMAGSWAGKYVYLCHERAHDMGGADSCSPLEDLGARKDPGKVLAKELERRSEAPMICASSISRPTLARQLARQVSRCAAS
jgi:hypothetical protein